MFYGVSEPLSAFLKLYGRHRWGRRGLRSDWAPLGGAAGDQVEANNVLGHGGNDLSLGSASWAIYAVVGLALAFVQTITRVFTLTISALRLPDLGRTCWGWPGSLIDHPWYLATLLLGDFAGFWVPRQPTRAERASLACQSPDVLQVLVDTGITAIVDRYLLLRGFGRGVKKSCPRSTWGWRSCCLVFRPFLVGRHGRSCRPLVILGGICRIPACPVQSPLVSET